MEDEIKYFSCQVCGRMIMAFGNAHDKIQQRCCDEFMVQLEEEEVPEEYKPQ
jgi:hypothetical protein